MDKDESTSTLQPGIYHAVQDRRQVRTKSRDWDIYDRFGKVATVFTLVSLRRRTSAVMHFGFGPFYVGLALQKFIWLRSPGVPIIPNVSIRWFEIKKETSLEGIC